MKIIYGIEKVPASKRSCVLVIGMFDGVHIGHQKIIKTAVERARAKERRSIVVTFDRHPAEVVKPESHPPILTPLSLKLRLFKELAVDMVVVIHFTNEFANLKPADFMNLVLSKFRVAEIIVGNNFHFGCRGAGDVRLLKQYGLKYGFKVVNFPLARRDGEAVSSTRIRKLLTKGDIEGTKSILGRYPLIWGKVVKGARRGRLLGFHTANIQSVNKVSLPRKGVYAGYIRILPRQGKRKCVIAIGSAPTFKESETRLEAHILDYKGNIYGKEVELEFIARLRDERVFANAQSLAEQVAKDIEEAKRVLKN